MVTLQSHYSAFAIKEEIQQLQQKELQRRRELEESDFSTNDIFIPQEGFSSRSQPNIIQANNQVF